MEVDKWQWWGRFGGGHFRCVAEPGGVISNSSGLDKSGRSGCSSTLGFGWLAGGVSHRDCYCARSVGHHRHGPHRPKSCPSRTFFGSCCKTSISTWLLCDAASFIECEDVVKALHEVRDASQAVVGLGEAVSDSCLRINNIMSTQNKILDKLNQNVENLSRRNISDELGERRRRSQSRSPHQRWHRRWDLPSSHPSVSGKFKLA